MTLRAQQVHWSQEVPHLPSSPSAGQSSSQSSPGSAVSIPSAIPGSATSWPAARRMTSRLTRDNLTW